MLIQSGPDSWASETIRRIRDRCKVDALYLARELLGRAYADANGGVNLFTTPAPYHHEANEVLAKNENAIILAPRGHLKTELITISGTISFLLRNPNHRVLIMSETPKTAMKSLRAIKDAMMNNERFRRFFPEYGIDTLDEEGTLNYFDVPCRTGPKKDFSVEVIGVGGATAGGHYDRIVTTDIVSDLTVPPAVTVETMMKTSARVDSLEPLLNKSNKQSHIIIEGTVWADGDPYRMALQNPGYRHYRKIVYSCWARGPNGPSGEPGAFLTREDGKRKPMWPELHTTEDLERMREKNVYLFSCYYENDPQPDPEEAMFKPSYFAHYRYGDPNEAPADEVWTRPGECPCCRGALNKAVTMDPAIGKKRKNDRTAMVTSGVCPLGSLVVVSTRAQRVEPGIIVEDLYNADQIDNPSWIGIETVAFAKLFLYILHEESRKPGRYALPIRTLQSDEQKERRIGMLAAFARSRKIWVRPGDHDELVDECLKMTIHGSMGRHDDLPDALAYRLQSMNRPSGPVLDVPERDRIPGTAKEYGEAVLVRIEQKEQEEMDARDGRGVV